MTLTLTLTLNKTAISLVTHFSPPEYIVRIFVQLINMVQK